LDARSDLFSFGAVLYEMTSGRMAFLGNTAAMIYEAILNRAPIPLSRLKPELPRKLEEIVNMTLEKDRKVRYQNAADIRTLRRYPRHKMSEQGRDRIGSTLGRFPAHDVLYGRNLTALRSTTEKTILAVAGAGWLRPSLCRRSVFSVPAVSLRVLHPFRSRRCKTHVPARVAWQNLKGFLDPYAIRSGTAGNSGYP
jgi:serine/threonine protein kinase